MTATTMMKKLTGRASPFEVAIDEVRKVLAEIEAQPAGKMSAPAYLAEACVNAGTDPDKLRALDARLARVPAEEREPIDVFLGGVLHKVRFVCADPPRENLMSLYGEGGATPIEWAVFLAALMPLSVRPLDLVALAVQRAVRDHAECFGERAASASAHEKRLAQLQARLGASSDAVTAAAHADGAVEFVVEDAGGRGRQFFLWDGARTPVAVHGPDAGARLVQWIAAQK